MRKRIFTYLINGDEDLVQNFASIFVKILSNPALTVQPNRHVMNRFIGIRIIKDLSLTLQ